MKFDKTKNRITREMKQATANFDQNSGCGTAPGFIGDYGSQRPEDHILVEKSRG
jgi:hypothetical protein